MTSGLPAGKIRILIVDDHPMLREGLAAVIRAHSGLELVGEARDGAEAVRLFTELRPDITLMDVQMPNTDGVAATKLIRADFPAARIIILTTYAGDAQAVKALKAGASGYLLKSTIRAQLISAIESVHAGARYLDPEVASEIALHFGDGELRERDIRTLQLVAAGKGNRQIAAEMHLSEEAVKSNLRTIFAKLNATDRTQAVVIAAKRGLITL